MEFVLLRVAFLASSAVRLRSVSLFCDTSMMPQRKNAVASPPGIAGIEGKGLGPDVTACPAAAMPVPLLAVCARRRQDQGERPSDMRWGIGNRLDSLSQVDSHPASFAMSKGYGDWLPSVPCAHHFLGGTWSCAAWSGDESIAQPPYFVTLDCMPNTFPLSPSPDPA
ncbi:hypothetical protein GLS40_03815 [Pseudooceanicola sp. 216_PA32_1]|uniref:Uncharacterized protein n=1 Tax=Pseudooceanicola pacificus TaxID=2676438 RepID=A0A844W362_9RHOB|nr:hypothetical protein [Pseudooceanicola pacificus]MWB77144.1 hypothetical protein [Pseudooceanicola pacificus]